MAKKNVLLYITTVWPEMTSSAAGLHSTNLIDAFLNQDWEVQVASPSKSNSFREQLESQGIPTHSFLPNDSTFDSFVTQLNPNAVLFDRFIMEEQFGWRVAENAPQAYRILDTQDLHTLRRARQKLLSPEQPDLSPPQIKLMTSNKLQDLLPDVLCREIASLHRCDLSLFLSDFEIELAVELGLPRKRIELFRFVYPSPPQPKSFLERKNLGMIGNFRHPPNLDGFHWLRKNWQAFREHSFEVHIYGAYPTEEVMRSNRPEEGFFVHGPAKDQFEALSQYRLSLAPLRFGAGIKGKISDSWFVGTPVLSTPIGAEGMYENDEFGGAIVNDRETLLQSLNHLYSDEVAWTKASQNGFSILQKFYHPDQGRHLVERVERELHSIEQIRQNHFTGRLLQHQTLQATKYFSRWIELKNKLK